MKVAIIAPTFFLNEYCNTGFHLCYAELALSSSTYKDYYRKKAESDIVILDHSPKLPRKHINLDSFYSALDLVDPDAVVLPNIDYSCDKTVVLSMGFTRTFESLPKCIGVLQGYSIEELIRCYRNIKEISDIIGLPASIERIISRNILIRKANITKPCIYLEVYSNPLGEVPSSSKVIGIATSFPVRLAYELRSLDEFKPTPKPLDFDLTVEPLPELTRRNINDYLALFE